jgi:hypothetical protein
MHGVGCRTQRYGLEYVWNMYGGKRCSPYPHTF